MATPSRLVVLGPTLSWPPLREGLRQELKKGFEFGRSLLNLGPVSSGWVGLIQILLSHPVVLLGNCLVFIAIVDAIVPEEQNRRFSEQESVIQVLKCHLSMVVLICHRPNSIRPVPTMLCSIVNLDGMPRLSIRAGQEGWLRSGPQQLRA
jgi:hypothetical protein